jgi:hypothetical protein
VRTVPPYPTQTELEFLFLKYLGNFRYQIVPAGFLDRTVGQSNLYWGHEFGIKHPLQRCNKERLKLLEQRAMAT